MNISRLASTIISALLLIAIFVSLVHKILGNGNNDSKSFDFTQRGTSIIELLVKVIRDN
jgi:hypothetical protein